MPNDPMLSEAMEVVETKQVSGCKLEIVEYKRLLGAGVPIELFYRDKLNMRLRTIRATLENGSFTTEPGQLHYMRGSVEMKVEGGGGVGGFLSRAVQSLATGETMYKTEFVGQGQVFLEPTFNHYLMVDIDDDEVVCDRGAFVAAAGKFTYRTKKPDGVAAGLLSGEGYFQPSIRGTGVVVLQSPVPQAELTAVELNNDKLVVDGNFAIARAGQIRMTIEKSAKSLMGTLRGGEGLVTVFSGTGIVWLAPTQRIYQSSAIAAVVS